MKNKRNKEQLMKVSNGITLIALVITIIVLLILAGVAIATLTGENGVLTKAKSAQTQTEQAKEDENLKIAIAGSYGTDGKLNLKDLKDNLENQEISYTNSDEFPLEVTVNGGKIEIKQDGTIEEVFDAEEWDKTATPEDCFVWGSDIEGEEGYDVIIAYTGKIESYTKLIIPSRCTKIDLNAYSYTNIPSKESRSFCTLIKTVELPSTITEIGGWAFSGNADGFKALENIIIPESVTSIGDAAFQNCTNLSSITIPSSVTSIRGDAFDDCTNLSSITIPNSVTSMKNDVFYNWTSSQTINIKGYTSAPSGWDARWNNGCSAQINWNQ